MTVYSRTRDERGWFVPGHGSFSRLVYEALVRGMSPTEIANGTGRQRKVVSVIASNIVHGRGTRHIPKDLIRVLPKYIVARRSPVPALSRFR